MPSGGASHNPAPVDGGSERQPVGGQIQSTRKVSSAATAVAMSCYCWTGRSSAPRSGTSGVDEMVCDCDGGAWSQTRKPEHGQAERVCTDAGLRVAGKIGPSSAEMSSKSTACRR